MIFTCAALTVNSNSSLHSVFIFFHSLSLYLFLSLPIIWQLDMFSLRLLHERTELMAMKMINLTNKSLFMVIYYVVCSESIEDE